MVRSQTTVNDTAWMKAMIPHHSIAILTSKRADLKDPEVKISGRNHSGTRRRNRQNEK